MTEASSVHVAVAGWRSTAPGDDGEELDGSVSEILACMALGSHPLDRPGRTVQLLRSSVGGGIAQVNVGEPDDHPWTDVVHRDLLARPTQRWRRMAREKVAQVDGAITRARGVRKLLRETLDHT